MKRLALLLVFAPVLVLAADQKMAPDGFGFERYVRPAAAGPNRLPVDLDLLTGAKRPTVVARPSGGGGAPSYVAVGGFDDLRFYDENRREVAYLLVPPQRTEPDWLSGRLLAIAATKRTSGFEVDLGRTLPVDRLRLEGLPTPFLKRARVEGSGDRERWTLLAPEVTVFDLPDEHLTRLDIDLLPGDFRYLRLTWDDTNSARLPLPRLATVRTTRYRAAAPPLSVPLSFVRIGSEPGTSRYRLTLPAARLPVVAIELEVSSGNVLRTARVTEGRFDGAEVRPVELGVSTLRRAVHDDLAAAALRVDFPAGAPEGSELELAIDDGDNPALEIRQVSAVFAELPWIYFETPSTAPLLARFGSTTLAAPHYDLEAARPSLDRLAPLMATWGERLPLTPAPSVPSTQAPGTTGGATLDTSDYRYRRTIPAGPRGLTAVALDASFLAHSQVSDARIASADGTQVPYVVETLAQPLTLGLEVPRPANPVPSALLESQGGRHLTAYPMALPVSGLPQSRLILRTTARVFDRRVLLVVEQPERGAADTIRFVPTSETRWSQADPEANGSALTLTVPPLSTRTLWLLVDEGDNSALPITQASLLLPAYRLRFYRESDGPLTLWYGHPSAAPPKYDLALLAPRIVGSAAVEVTPGPEQAVASGERMLRGGVIFWAALGLAVVVLLGLVARLLRNP